MVTVSPILAACQFLVRATWRAHELAALFQASSLASAASGAHW